MKKSKRNIEIKHPEIAVFSLKSGSQWRRLDEGNRGSYDFVMTIFNSMMRKSNVWSPKIGFGSTREDMAFFISGLINIYLYSDTDINLIEDINEYNPDYRKYYKENFD